MLLSQTFHTKKCLLKKKKKEREKVVYASPSSVDDSRGQTHDSTSQPWSLFLLAIWQHFKTCRLFALRDELVTLHARKKKNKNIKWCITESRVSMLSLLVSVWGREQGSKQRGRFPVCWIIKEGNHLVVQVRPGSFLQLAANNYWFCKMHSVCTSMWALTFQSGSKAAPKSDSTTLNSSRGCHLTVVSHPLFKLKVINPANNRLTIPGGE